MATDAPARPDSKRTEVGTMPYMGNGSEYQGSEPYDLTDNSICTQCGECCTNRLPISDSDIRRIRRYIRRHGIRPAGHIPAVIAGPVLDMVCDALEVSSIGITMLFGSRLKRREPPLSLLLSLFCLSS